jgi:hypothetical protein
MVFIEEDPWRALLMAHLCGHFACDTLLSLTKCFVEDHAGIALVDPYDSVVSDHEHWHLCLWPLLSVDEDLDG